VRATHYTERYGQSALYHLKLRPVPNIPLRPKSTILSSIYPLSPNLQSLCIMPAEQTSTTLWTEFKRAIPILTTSDLDEEAADEVQTFLNSVVSTPDLIILFDAKGKSVWSSIDLPLKTEWDGATVLRRHLSRALKDPRPVGGGGGGEGEAMDLG
jgi:hypothetical protein